MTHSSAYGIASLLLLLMLTGGCAHRTTPEALPRLFWPPPPAEPRLEFIGTFRASMPSPTDRNRKAPRYSHLIGSIPVDAVADAHGTVYLTEKSLQNILVHHPDTKAVTLLFKQPLASPHGIAMDDEGLLYLSDSAMGTIRVFTTGGEPVLTIRDPQHLSRPTYLAVSSRYDRIFVADEKEDRVVAFDRRGTYLFSIGGPGSDPGQFRRPRGLALDQRGRLHVADSNNGRLQVFDVDGHFLGILGDKGSSVPLLAPTDMDFDSEGHLYIIDEKRNALFILSDKGQLLLVVGSGNPTSHSMGFSNPSAIDIDGNDRIYIVDCFNGRVSVWQYLNTAYLQAHPVTTEDRERLLGYITASKQGEMQKPDSIVCFWGLCFDTTPPQEAPQPAPDVPEKAR